MKKQVEDLKIMQKKNDSIVTDLFQGQFKESTKCVFCSNIYNRYPHFLSIGLPLPDKNIISK